MKDKIKYYLFIIGKFFLWFMLYVLIYLLLYKILSYFWNYFHYCNDNNKMNSIILLVFILVSLKIFIDNKIILVWSFVWLLFSLYYLTYIVFWIPLLCD